MGIGNIVDKLKGKKSNSVSAAPPKNEILGYYVCSEDECGFAQPFQNGQILQNEDIGPPWIIVDHSLESTSISGWPISLWRAKVLKAISPQDHIGNYTRCTAIEILNEVPPYKLFSDADIGLVDIIEFGQQLSLDLATKLAACRSGAADQIINKVWEKWTDKNQIEGREYHDDWAGTLMISQVNCGSPVRGALMTIDTQITARAESLVGESVINSDEDGIIYLSSPWDQASAALLDAALALGANDVLEPGELDKLYAPLRATAPELYRSITTKNKTF